jgi:hypothetical protein
MPKYPTDPMSQKSEEAPQDICDKRGPDYDNNTREKWLTGAVPATPQRTHHAPSLSQCRASQ